MLRRIALVLLVAACGGKTDEPPVATRVIGTEKGDPNDPSSGRDPVEDGGTLGVSEGGVLRSCGGNVTSFGTGFETGNVADDFTVNEPAAFSTVTTNAIQGQYSLRIAADASAYLAHKLPNVCKLTLTFDVRLSAATVASGVKLAQIDAQHHFWALIVEPGGGIGFAQSVTSTGGGTTGEGVTLEAEPFAQVRAETPTHVSFAVDIAARSLTMAVEDASGSSTNSAANGYVTTGGDDVAIDEIDFGSAPDRTGPSPSPSGTWLLDDVTLQ